MVTSVYGQHLTPVSIKLPCSLFPLRELMKTTKLALRNNFIPCFLSMAASIITFHYTSVLEINDECPITLLYSSCFGTGE